MGKFEDTITKAREILGETGKAAEEVIFVQKLKFKLTSLKSELNKLYAALGEHTYLNAVKGEENAEPAAEVVAKITEKLEEIEELEKEIAAHNGSRICDCGAINKQESKYCNTCGKEL